MGKESTHLAKNMKRVATLFNWIFMSVFKKIMEFIAHNLIKILVS